MSDQTSREQQAEIATQAINRMEDLIAGLPEPAPFYKAFAEATDEILKAAALRAPVRPQENEDSGAGLIGQTIPDVDGTEPRPGDIQRIAIDAAVRVFRASEHWTCPQIAVAVAGDVLRHLRVQLVTITGVWEPSR